MKTGTKVAIGFGVVGTIGLILLVGGAAGAGVDNGRTRTPGTKQPGGGKKWGTKGPPVGFDRFGNGLWISPDCETVQEAAKFWPEPAEVHRVDPKLSTDPAIAKGRICNIVDTRALPQQTYGCTALDVVDTLIIDQGLNAKDIADTIIRQHAPLCFDAPVSEWPDAFYNYYNDLLDRLVGYVEEKLLYLEEEHGDARTG